MVLHSIDANPFKAMKGLRMGLSMCNYIEPLKGLHSDRSVEDSDAFSLAAARTSSTVVSGRLWLGNTGRRRARGLGRNRHGVESGRSHPLSREPGIMAIFSKRR